MFCIYQVECLVAQVDQEHRDRLMYKQRINKIVSTTRM